MKMVIMNKLFPEKAETVVDPKFIPRIGERIAIWYNPSPIVKEVIHILSEDTIMIIVE